MITLSNKPRTVPQPAARNSGAAPNPAPAAMAPDLIRTRAYELFLSRLRFGIAGDDVTDWLQAERELTAAPPKPVVTEIKARIRGETLLRTATD